VGLETPIVLDLLSKNLAAAFLGVLAAIPSAYLTAKAHVVKALTSRLEKLSDGRLSSLEDLVAAATREQRLRSDTPIRVLGEDLWTEVRRCGFRGATQQVVDAKIAVVDTHSVSEEEIGRLEQPYALIFYPDPGRYQGKLPPGADCTYANSLPTLDARLMELLRFSEARE
jgi:hypothetical protein